MALLKGDLKRRAQLLDKLKAALRAVLAAREEQGLYYYYYYYYQILGHLIIIIKGGTQGCPRCP